MTEREKIIDRHYNKHKEELRLGRRHGIVEYRVSMHYIEKYMPKERTGFKVLDLGAATGRYSFALAEMGCDVTAVELVKRNVEVLRSNGIGVRAIQGNALDLSFLGDGEFDMVVNFGPLYHLVKEEDKLRAVGEAKRVAKANAVIMNAYLLNEYSILSYCFDEDRMTGLMERGAVSDDFRIKAAEDELYDYVRIGDIDRLNAMAGLRREVIFSPDGPSDYMRTQINRMSDEVFEEFVRYQMLNAERGDLIGAGSHVVDVVRKA